MAEISEGVLYENIRLCWFLYCIVNDKFFMKVFVSITQDISFYAAFA